MRTSMMLLVVSLFGMLAGAALLGRWAIGVVILGWSLLLAVFALLRDDGSVTHASVEPLNDGSEEDRFRRRVVESYLRRSA